MNHSTVSQQASLITALARWLIPLGAILLAPVAFDPQPSGAVITRMYTLPFYSSWSITQEGCFGCYPGHEGTDYELGTPGQGGEVVAAAAAGTAKPCGPDDLSGNYVVIDHLNGHRTRYLHFNTQALPGDRVVARGERIGYEGNLGYTDPDDFYHLHFETRHGAQGAATCGKDGTAVNPYASNTYMWEDQPPGGQPPSHADLSPAVASWISSRVDVFVRGKDNDLWQRTRSGSTWGAWTRPHQGDCLRSAPAASTWSTSRIDVFYRGCNDVLYWTKWTGSSWTPSTPFTGSCTLGAPAATSWGTNRIDVFYRGCSNNVLYWTYTTNGGATWSAHTAVPYANCLRSGPGAVSWGSGRLDIVYRGCDDAIWHHWYTGSAWQPNESFGGCTMVAPSIASWGSTKLDVFHRGCGPAGSEGIFQKSFNGSSWTGWTSLGGCLASGPGTDAWAPDWLNVIYRGCDSPANMYNAYWNGGAWTHLNLVSWP